MKWYIGQDIVCIKTHSQNKVKEGDVYVILGLKQVCCKVIINVGIPASAGFSICKNCKEIISHEDNMHWIGEILFAPLDSLTDITEIEELLKEPIY